MKAVSQEFILTQLNTCMTECNECENYLWSDGVFDHNFA